MTLRVGLTHPVLAQLKLTWMDYLLTMLRNRLRRKLSYDTRVRRAQGPRRNADDESCPTFARTLILC